MLRREFRDVSRRRRARIWEVAVHLFNSFINPKFRWPLGQRQAKDGVLCNQARKRNCRIRRRCRTIIIVLRSSTLKAGEEGGRNFQKLFSNAPLQLRRTPYSACTVQLVRLQGQPSKRHILADLRTDQMSQ